MHLPAEATQKLQLAKPTKSNRFMNPKLKSFIQRTITAIFLVAVMLWAILYGPYSFVTFFAILVFGILWEFYTLINVSRECHIFRPLHSLGGTLLFVCAFLSSSHVAPVSIFLFYLAYMMMLFISRLYTKQENPIREIAFIILGQVYISCPLSLLSGVAFHTQAFPMGEMMRDYCPIFVLSLFFFIWINDTGAYLTGMTCSSLMKTHKLFPRVSPKKTWEGVWGGLIFAMLLGWFLSHEFIWNLFGINLHDGVRLSLVQWIGMGLVVSIFSTYGDLIESFVKRAVGVKDSGNILPGHGGLWDRFDSLIMAAPAMLIYLVLTAFFK